MTQIPLYFGPRYPAINGRSSNALALWRARDGLLTPATESTPITWAATPSTVRSLTKDSNGNYVSVSQYVPRPHYFDIDGDGVLETPTLSIGDGDGANRCGYSEDFTNWTAVNSGTILTPTITLGEVTLSLLSDTSGTLQRYWERTPNTGGYTKMVLSFFLAKGTINAAGGASAVVWDNTASANRLVATWTWTTVNGIDFPLINASTGKLMLLEYCGKKSFKDPATNRTTLADVWRVHVRTNTSYSTTNSNRIRLSPANTAAQQANEFFGGVQLSAYATSRYVKTTGSGLAGGDLATWSMLFSGVPQAMTLAVRFIYSGVPECFTTGVTGTVCAVTNAAGGLPRLWIGQSDGSAGTNYQAQIADGVNPALNVSHNVTPSPGDVVLLRLSLAGDGSLEFGLTINEGAEAVVQSGNPYGLPASWVSNSAVRLTEGSRGGEFYLGIGVFAGAPSAAYLNAVLT